MFLRRQLSGLFHLSSPRLLSEGSRTEVGAWLVFHWMQSPLLAGFLYLQSPIAKYPESLCSWNSFPGGSGKQRPRVTFSTRIDQELSIVSILQSKFPLDSLFLKMQLKSLRVSPNPCLVSQWCWEKADIWETLLMAWEKVWLLLGKQEVRLSYAHVAIVLISGSSR